MNDTDDEMTEAEIAKHFGAKLRKPRLMKGPKLSEMSLEQIEEWEKQQDNSNDIYKVAARVKNLATPLDGSLTSTGIMLCNSFTHVFKDLYDFAETIRSKKTKTRLIELIRSKEKIPGDLIAALRSGVKG